MSTHCLMSTHEYRRGSDVCLMSVRVTDFLPSSFTIIEGAGKLYDARGSLGGVWAVLDARGSLMRTMPFLARSASRSDRVGAVLAHSSTGAERGCARRSWAPDGVTGGPTDGLW